MGIAGSVAISSGYSTRSKSGSILLATSKGGIADGSGNISISSGNAHGGPSGSIAIETGAASAGHGGAISAIAGSSTDVKGASVNIRAGSAIEGETVIGGDVVATSGYSSLHSSGEISLSTQESIQSGSIIISSGAGNVSGSVVAATGISESASHHPGEVVISVGFNEVGNGGGVHVIAGDMAASASTGGEVLIQAGNGDSEDKLDGGDGGTVFIRGGNASGRVQSTGAGLWLCQQAAHRRAKLATLPSSRAKVYLEQVAKLALHLGTFMEWDPVVMLRYL